MRVAVIGAGGMIGGKLCRAIAAKGALRGAEIDHLTMIDLAAPTPVDAPFSVSVEAVDIAAAGAETRLLGEGADVIFHLAAIVSGQAEADFDLGWAVNMGGTRAVLEAARALETAPVLVYASSMAVFGGEIPEHRPDQPIADWTHLNPQTSYGAQKAVGELMLNDYSRKGFVDGRGLRLPTISIRPGKPNKAASSFMSSIFREPLQGQEAICPVDPDYAHFYLSPRRCVENLIHAAELPAEPWGQNRCLMLPGRSHRIGEMIDAMGRIAGSEAVARIRFEPDYELRKIVLGWTAWFDTAKADSLGFVRDDSFEDNIRFFLEDDVA